MFLLRLCFLVLLIQLSNSSFSETIDVCPSCATTSISEAIQKSNRHDTVLVQQGTYLEHGIIIDHPLTLLGMHKPVIDGEGLKGIIEVYADSVTISGFVLQNVGVSYTSDYAAIYLSRCKNFRITDNILQNVFFGMLIEKSHDGLIANNQISSKAVEQYNSGNGIHAWHCSELMIRGNEVHNVRDGIYLEFVEDSEIVDNLSYDNLRYGLHFMFSNNDDYYNNEFINNGAGVAVMFSKYINMKKNLFYKNWGTASFGLLLKEIYDAEIEDNIFQENSIGVHVEGSNRINYVRNDFERNGWAVKIAGGCYSNIFRENNFLNNSFDISYNSKMNDNGFQNNYWSSYSGYDLDRDGVGDVPYRPVKLFSYVVNRTPETIILLRSLFIDILNFSERVSPVFTPDELVDSQPKMTRIND